MKRPVLVTTVFLLLACQPDAGLDMTLYSAKNIVTVNESLPVASGVLVDKTGRIVDVGDFSKLKRDYPGAAVDTRFEGKTITPGLIDPHIHMMLGAMMYALDFIPPWDMETPAGTVKGLPDKVSLLAKIEEFETTAPDGPLILYGYHNLIHGDLTRHDLDKIKTTRPLYIWHYSGHDFYLNSAAIKQADLSPALAETFHGVGLDENGELNGRIFEDAALALFATVGTVLMAPDHIEKGWNGYEKIFARSGVTTVAEMGYGLFGRALEESYIKQHYSEQDNYRLYLVPEVRAFEQEFGADAPARIQEMSANKALNPPVLKQVKLFTDAAFYSQTMKMAAPGYIGGQSKGTDGLWVTPRA